MTRSENRGATRVDDGVVVPEQRSRPAPVREDVVVDRPATGNRWDRVRWGPIWAGALVVLTTFVVLQLFFFALGWLNLGYDGVNSAAAAGIVSGVLLLVAFFIGALMTGAATMWRSATDGMMHGVVVWALSITLLLILGLLGGSSLLGPLGDAIAQANGPTPSAVTPAQVLSTARQSAGWAALLLGLTVLVAAVGGMVGSKIWPSREDTPTR